MCFVAGNNFFEFTKINKLLYNGTIIKTKTIIALHNLLVLHIQSHHIIKNSQMITIINEDSRGTGNNGKLVGGGLHPHRLIRCQKLAKLLS